MKRETIINRRNELLKDHKKGSITVLFAGDLVKDPQIVPILLS